MSTPPKNLPAPCQQCQNTLEKPNDRCQTKTGSCFCHGCCPKDCAYYALCYLKAQTGPKAKPQPSDYQKHSFLDLLKKEPWGLQATAKTLQTLNHQDTVAFSQTLCHYGANVHYDPQTGTFTIFEPGTFKVFWWIMIEATFKSPIARFALTLNNSPLDPISLPQASGQLVGHSLFATTHPNTTLTLQNATNDQVLLSQASLMLHSL